MLFGFVAVEAVWYHRQYARAYLDPRYLPPVGRYLPVSRHAVSEFTIHHKSDLCILSQYAHICYREILPKERWKRESIREVEQGGLRALIKDMKDGLVFIKPKAGKQGWTLGLIKDGKQG